MKNLNEASCFACLGTGRSDESILDPVKGLIALKCLVCDGRGKFQWHGVPLAMREPLMTSTRENTDENPL